ncbi:MAG: hypothetical protein A3J55_03075 [Candidatus Ryanbacteria bacterium RIFCSPHIGHO2_02_FULL_45_17b]|nr:MAG: hypothetical protein A3J55_03075 [Candidatus Ryanbacteria bacterium RIFCSPHIGHO2_02_FULL_45_17b]
MITDSKTTVDGLQIFYRIGGNLDKPPLIFLHGWGSRIDSFGSYVGITGTVEELAKHFYVFAPELPGLLRSDAPKSVWNYEQFAEIIFKLANTLNWKPSVVMGQSFGGGVATAFAKLYPDFTKALIIVDSVVSKRPQNSYMTWLYAWANFRKKIFPSPFVPRFLKKLLINLYFGTPMKFIDNKNIKDKIIMSDIDLTRNLVVDYNRLKMPLIIVWGDKDTWVTPISRAKEIHKETLDSKLIIEKGGHPVLYKKPKIVIDDILKALPQNL